MGRVLQVKGSTSHIQYIWKYLWETAEALLGTGYVLDCSVFLPTDVRCVCSTAVKGSVHVNKQLSVLNMTGGNSDVAAESFWGLNGSAAEIDAFLHPNLFFLRFPSQFGFLDICF